MFKAIFKISVSATSMRRAFQFTVAVGFVAMFAPMVSASPSVKQDESKQENFSERDLEFFENKVRPLLIDKCFSCHGPDADPAEGGLSLHSRSAVLSGGDTGAAIVIGEPKQSLLIDAINYGDIYQMPPDSKMSADEIAALTKWVEMGAPWPSEQEVAMQPSVAFDLQGRKANHWCWQPIKSPHIPSVQLSDWPRDNIDNFILRRIEDAGLTPAETADRRTLIRRVYFDLIGLPPSPAQVQRFVDDSSPDAFANVVDELLSSPRFGEHWARRWMDLARYAESYGHEFDYEIEHAHQYRDYLIRAFNEDVPYDEIIQEHIAGDLLVEPRRHPDRQFNESVIATGFWFLGEATHAPVDVRGDEAGRIDNQIDVMSKAFLGLTVACARCHDHKFDAISTEDYYALAGFLQSSRRQLAMLDVDRRIESACKQSAELVRNGDTIIRDLTDRINHHDDVKVNKYVTAAIEYLRSDSGWTELDPIRLQGEDLKELLVSGGKSQVQALKSANGFHWEGNSQLWWTDGKIDDSLKLQFELKRDGGPIDYALTADFTKAHDYGAADILVDGKIVKEHIDFFEPKLAKTGRLDLGTVKLGRGKHEIEFKLVDHDERAQPRNMIGLDWIELQPIPQTNEQAIKAAAKKDDIDQSLLVRFVEAIKAYQPGRLPVLDLLHQSAQPDAALDKQFQETMIERAQSQLEEYRKWQDGSVLFADFENGLPNDWFKTGFAFNLGSNQRHIFSPVGAIARQAGTIHSGIGGPKYWGVIRSPTFTLEHEQIHYRLRGRNVTIRLIVDGYELNTFNELLFKGARIEIDQSVNFAWHTQAQDLKNHLGHRAFIEIIDSGDGFVELDEIRFSDTKPPSSHVTQQLSIATVPDENADVVKAISRLLLNQLDTETNSGNRELAAWIIEHELVEVFAGQGKEKEVSAAPANTDAYQTVASGQPIKNRHPADLTAELIDIREKIRRLNEITPAPELAIAITDGTSEDEHVFIRGNHKALGDVATRRFLSAISARPLNPAGGSGRLELAQKITAPNNPLTSRVIVNRLWHHLMGRGIVESVDNFGVLGKNPSHPELLDHLATSFQADGRSIKNLIRRIVLTKTYQLSSQPNADAQKVDPRNELMYRAQIKRLSGEAIRDSILQISGRLDLEMFGPSIPIHLTPFMQGRGRPEKSGPLDGGGRRSIYISVKRNFLSPMILAFDTPIPFNTIGRRNQSNVPAQALILMNDPFVSEQASIWAQRLSEQSDDVSDRVNRIYLQALGRPPAEWEVKSAIRFIEQQATEMEIETENILNAPNVWLDLCHVMFNLKEFIFIK
jgi:hypothetical protein